MRIQQKAGKDGFVEVTISGSIEEEPIVAKGPIEKVRETLKGFKTTPVTINNALYIDRVRVKRLLAQAGLYDGRSRPRKPVTRDRIIRLRLTESEYAELVRRAEEQRLTISDTVRQSLFA